MATGRAYDEKCDVYSFGQILLDMSVPETLMEYLSSEYHNSFSVQPALDRSVRRTTSEPPAYCPPFLEEVLSNCFRCFRSTPG